MGILIFLVPLALLISGLGVASYVWACRNRQFEDLDTPPTKMLFDDEIREDRYE